MARVPLDIQSLVIELVYMSCQHEAIDYSTLRTCALVCRAWKHIAQRLLFRRVPISKPKLIHTNKSKSARLLRTLSAAPHLASHVRSITIILDQERGWSEDLEVLGLCSHVEGVFIVADRVPADSLSALTERLRTMRIRPVFLSVSGRPTVVSALLHVWPSARALEVEAWYDAELATMRTQPSVEALSIHTDWINEAFLRHLVSSSVFPRLRSLCITGSFVATPAPRAVFEHLARIESLVLAWLPAEAMALPQTLRHLGYHFYGIGKEPIAGARLLMDAARALPELTRVTAMRCSSPEVLKEFERACEDYGVELVVYEKPWCFPRPGNVDWI